MTSLLLTASFFNHAKTTFDTETILDMHTAVMSSQQPKLMGQNYVTVGFDNQCTYSGDNTIIQDAINDGATEIRVATGTYQENITIDSDVLIIGGFSDCTAAENIENASNLLADRSVLVAASQNPVVTLNGGDTELGITMANMAIRDGDGTTNPNLGAGGINVISMDGTLFLDDVLIANNKGTSGGGMGIFGSSEVDIVMSNVLLFENEANEGGGLYCGTLNSNILMLDNSGISSNEAIDGSGGGLLLRTGCTATVLSGTDSSSLFDLRGISFNTANGDGGGAAVESGSTLNLFGNRLCNESICLGDNSEPINVNNNQTTLVFTNAGGGIFSQGALTRVNIVNALIKENKAEYGAGINSINGAQLIATTSGAECWSPGSCTQFNGNIASHNTGGLANSGTALVIGAHFYNNHAETGGGTAVTSSGENGVTTLAGVTAYGNGDTNQYNDASVMSAQFGGTLNVLFSTIADNDSNQGHGIIKNGESHVTLLSSIVHQGPNSDTSLSPYQSTAPMSDLVKCVVTHDDTPMDNVGGTHLHEADPAFVDRANQNYHIDSGNSPALDLCDQSETADFLQLGFGLGLDTDGEVRGFDDPFVENDHGRWDAGADETYGNDLIFKSGFWF